MKILALDLGKSKTVACIFDSESGEHRFTKTSPRRPEMVKLLSDCHGHRVVMEIGPSAGWIHDLAVELEALAAANAAVRKVSEKLNQLAHGDVPTAALQTITGVGVRTAEALLAVIDKADRFKNKKQVGSYVGLTPRKYQSGNSDRQGRISGQGNRLLRKLLVQSAWVAVRYGGWARAIFQQVSRGMPGRRKIAIVAVARRLLIVAWAMLRDGTEWLEPQAPPIVARL